MDLKSTRGDATAHVAICMGVVTGGYAYLGNDDGDDEDGLTDQQDVDCPEGKAEGNNVATSGRELGSVRTQKSR
eukprot:8054124-Pyramimonas_sp.AAC.1